MSKPLNLIYGISSENKLVHISEVVSGKACNCTCPSCNTPLIAKKGSVKIPHFAHQSTEICEYGYETSLHMAAKEILSNTKYIYLPEVVFDFKGIRREKKISPERELFIDRVELEHKIGSVIPDIVVYSGSEKIFVEIFVTHKVDEDKRKKIKELNVSTLEIDLSKQRDILTIEELEETLIGNKKNKYWIYHSQKEAYKQAIYSIAKKRRLFKDEAFFDEYITRGCPLKITKLGRYYVALEHYCWNCKYCIERNEENRNVFCAGESLIGDISDFKVSLDERIKECIIWLEKFDLDFVESDICPYCRGFLKHEKTEGKIFYKCIDCDFGGIYNESTKKLEVKTVGHQRKY